MHFVRFAGNNERRCIIRENLGLYGTIVTVGTYSGPCEGFPSQEALRSDITLALRNTVIQHPALSTAIQDADTENPQLVRVSVLDLDNHLSFVQSDANTQDEIHSLRRVLRIAHEQPPLDPKTPQWRVFFAPLPSQAPSTYRFNLAFTCSHSISDGVSSNLFHTTFVNALRNVRNLPPASGPIKHPACGSSVPPPVDQPADMTISWSFLLAGPALFECLPKFLKRLLGACEYWSGAARRPEIPKCGRLIPTEVQIASIPPEVVKGVLMTCKRNNGKLTGLLTHLTGQALSRSLHARGQTNNSFLVETAMDFRRNLPHGQGKMINYAVGSNEILTTTTPPRNPTQRFTPDDWAAVQRSTAKLSADATRMRDQPMALLRYLSGYRAWILKKSASRAESSFISSNLGTFDGTFPKDSGADQQSWRIEEMAFSQSANGTGPPFTMNVASARGGSLSLIMTWWPGMLGVEDEHAFASEICREVEDRLKVLAAESMEDALPKYDEKAFG